MKYLVPVLALATLVLALAHFQGTGHHPVSGDEYRPPGPLASPMELHRPGQVVDSTRSPLGAERIQQEGPKAQELRTLLCFSNPAGSPIEGLQFRYGGGDYVTDKHGCSWIESFTSSAEVPALDGGWSIRSFFPQMEAGGIQKLLCTVTQNGALIVDLGTQRGEGGAQIYLLREDAGDILEFGEYRKFIPGERITLPAGMYSCRVRSGLSVRPKASDKPYRFSLSSGETQRLSFSFSDAAAVSLRIVDEEGRPVTGASMFELSAAREQFMGGRVISDENGYIRCAADLPVSAFVAHHDFRTTLWSSSGSSDQEETITLERDGEVLQVAVPSEWPLDGSAWRLRSRLSSVVSTASTATEAPGLLNFTPCSLGIGGELQGEVYGGTLSASIMHPSCSQSFSLEHVTLNTEVIAEGEGVRGWRASIYSQLLPTKITYKAEHVASKGNKDRPSLSAKIIHSTKSHLSQAQATWRTGSASGALYQQGPPGGGPAQVGRASLLCRDTAGSPKASCEVCVVSILDSYRLLSRAIADSEGMARAVPVLVGAQAVVSVGGSGVDAGITFFSMGEEILREPVEVTIPGGDKRRVHTRIIDEKGQPIAGMPLKLLSNDRFVQTAFDKGLGLQEGVSDDEGWIRWGPQLPGSYVVYMDPNEAQFGQLDHTWIIEEREFWVPAGSSSVETVDIRVRKREKIYPK